MSKRKSTEIFEGDIKDLIKSFRHYNVLSYLPHDSQDSDPVYYKNQEVLYFLDSIDLSKINGIGLKTRENLNELGIISAYDFFVVHTKGVPWGALDQKIIPTPNRLKALRLIQEFIAQAKVPVGTPVETPAEAPVEAVITPSTIEKALKDQDSHPESTRLFRGAVLSVIIMTFLILFILYSISQ
jgi:hypothetical protein